LRSSAGITPKTLVASGLNCLFNNTTAFFEKQNDKPEERFRKVEVLTITPYKTSPFLTLDVSLFFFRIC